jgi:hypothetical protein
MIVAAENALEGHRHWLHRHRDAWAESVKQYQHQLNSKRRIWALKRLLLRLFLIGPIICITLVRVIARALRRARELLSSSVLPPLVRAKPAHIRPTKTVQTPQHRISGLDGPLCTGQPWSPQPSVITESRHQKKTSGESGVLPARLVVASLGAVIVGCFAAAATPDGHKETAEVPPNASTHSAGGNVPPMAQNEPEGIEEPISYQYSGFSVLAAPATERLSPPGMTVAEIISIAQPSTEIVVPSEKPSEPAEVTVPARKPQTAIKAKPKPSQIKQKQQRTVWELPWLH